LQQTTGVAEQHLTVIGEPDTARRAPEQRTFGPKFEALDLLTYRRPRQVRRSAARWKPPQSATATKARNSSKSSTLIDLGIYPAYPPVSRLGPKVDRPDRSRCLTAVPDRRHAPVS
jgi:hypothetical protein